MKNTDAMRRIWPPYKLGDKVFVGDSGPEDWLIVRAFQMSRGIGELPKFTYSLERNYENGNRGVVDNMPENELSLHQLAKPGLVHYQFAFWPDQVVKLNHRNSEGCYRIERIYLYATAANVVRDYKIAPVKQSSMLISEVELKEKVVKGSRNA